MGLETTGQQGSRKEMGDINVCDESPIIAQAGPFLSVNAVTQYASLKMFDAQ